MKKTPNGGEKGSPFERWGGEISSQGARGEDRFLWYLKNGKP